MKLRLRYSYIVNSKLMYASPSNSESPSTLIIYSPDQPIFILLLRYVDLHHVKFSIARQPPTHECEWRINEVERIWGQTELKTTAQFSDTPYSRQVVKSLFLQRKKILNEPRGSEQSVNNTKDKHCHLGRTWPRFYRRWPPGIGTYRQTNNFLVNAK